MSGEYTVLHANDGLSLQWFTAFTHTPYFQLTCFHSSIGVDVEKMVFKFDWWLKHDLCVPPLPEQNKIAEILSTWDEAIEQTRALIAAAKRRKKALMHQLLTGKWRLPGFIGKWKTSRLGYLVSINPETLPESTDRGREFRYIDLSSVESGALSLPPTTTRFCDAPSRARRLLKTGDILLATVRPGLHGYAYVDFDAGDCVCSTGFAVLRPKSAHVGGFVYQLLYGEPVQRQFYAMVTGSSYPALNEGDVASVHVTVPDPPEQRAIATILTTADEEIKSLEAKCAALERQKKGLMQKLLTGEIRVKG